MFDTRIYLITEARTLRLLQLFTIKLYRSLQNYIWLIRSLLFIVDAVLRVFELDTSAICHKYNPFEQTVRSTYEEEDQRSTVRSERKKAFFKRRSNISSRTPLRRRLVEKFGERMDDSVTDINMAPSVQQLSQHFNSLELKNPSTPSTRASTRRPTLSHAPASLPPTASLPPIPTSTTNTNNSLQTRRPRPSAINTHPLISSRRLRPLTPIFTYNFPPTPPPSPPPPPPSWYPTSAPRMLYPTPGNSGAVDTDEEDNDEDMELEMDWRAMLELFPTPRSFSGEQIKGKGEKGGE